MKLSGARVWDPNARVEIKAHTTSLRLLWRRNVTGAYVGANSEEWDLRDLWGSRLANGTYVVQVSVTAGGQTRSKRQFLMVLR
jgi:hypothetical protein